VGRSVRSLRPKKLSRFKDAKISKGSGSASLRDSIKSYLNMTEFDFGFSSKCNNPAFKCYKREKIPGF
jgi:hypothetical protein